MLGEAAAIPGGGVVEADAGVPCRGERAPRNLFVDRGIELAQRAAAEAEWWHRERRVVDPASFAQ
jgi:hypothetical protein